MMEGKYSEAISAMLHMVRMHRRAIESIVESTGIHHSQHRLLMHIAKGNTAYSQKELAEIMGVSAAAITNALSKLEKDGYIERSCASDVRRNEIRITDSGRAIVENSKKHFQAIDEMLFEGFDDDDIRLYLSFIDRMQKNATKILERKEREK